jgi:hypothetical protein
MARNANMAPFYRAHEKERRVMYSEGREQAQMRAKITRNFYEQ